jgi:hypothetical protein
MSKPKLIAADINYVTSIPERAARKLSLYYVKGIGFFIAVESLNYIESVDELSAREHYKFMQKKYQKFPQTQNTELNRKD